MTIPEYAKGLSEQIRENRERLESCPLHDFERKSSNGTGLFRAVCKNCKGELDAVQAHFYKLGLEHAKNLKP